MLRKKMVAIFSIAILITSFSLLIYGYEKNCYTELNCSERGGCAGDSGKSIECEIWCVTKFKGGDLEIHKNCGHKRGGEEY